MGVFQAQIIDNGGVCKTCGHAHHSVEGATDCLKSFQKNGRDLWFLHGHVREVLDGKSELLSKKDAVIFSICMNDMIDEKTRNEIIKTLDF